jgi:ABC-type Fe3+-hydroxamate transport system substrate-binding protein
VYQELGTARATQTSKPRTTILLGPEEGKYLVMGVEGFHSWILKECGATPVGVAGTMFQEAKLESLIDWDPQVIYSDGHAQDIYADPRLQQLSAVKQQHVYDYDGKTLVRVAGNLNSIIKQMSSDISKLPVAPRQGAKP